MSPFIAKNGSPKGSSARHSASGPAVPSGVVSVTYSIFTPRRLPSPQ